jgi:hypothetical protein
MKVIIITILASLLSGTLYRFGGAAKKGDKWDWLRWSKTRDWGCPLIVLGMTFLFGFGASTVWYLHLISFLLAWGALTTYWDDIFGYDNFYVHGFMIGLAFLPYVYSMDPTAWVWFLARAGVMGVFMGLWCDFNDNDIVEEVGRGAIITATVPMLLI